MLLTTDPVTSLANVRHFEVIIVTNIIIIHCVFSSLSPLELGAYQCTNRQPDTIHSTERATDAAIARTKNCSHF